jgi:hypothetical protein
MARNAYPRGAETKQGKTQIIRNHAHRSLAEEKEFLAPFLEKARCGGILVANEIHRAMEAHLGGKIALACAENLLHRHNWRKLAPDKRTVEADVRCAGSGGGKLPNRLARSAKEWEWSGLRTLWATAIRTGGFGHDVPLYLRQSCSDLPDGHSHSRQARHAPCPGLLPGKSRRLRLPGILPRH